MFHDPLSVVGRLPAVKNPQRILAGTLTMRLFLNVLVTPSPDREWLFGYARCLDTTGGGLDHDRDGFAWVHGTFIALVHGTRAH